MNYLSCSSFVHTRRINDRSPMQGTTLPSLLVALSLISITLYYTLPAVHALVKTTTIIRREAFAQRTAARLSTIASHIMQDADTHRLPFAVKVHSNGGIIFQSGSPHPITDAASTLRPGHSDGVTVLALDSQRILIPTTKTEIGSTNSWIEGCAVEGGSSPQAPHRSFLSLSADGPAEVVADSFSCLASGCCGGYLRIEESLTVPQAPQKRVLLLVPILHQLTYYVSEADELRLFQQVGSTMIENQPLYRSVPPLSITIAWEPAPSISITTNDLPLSRYPIRHFGSLRRASYDYLLSLGW